MSDPEDDDDEEPGNCISCGCPLGIPGGMAGTDLCGPCCTGEAETLDEEGVTW